MSRFDEAFERTVGHEGGFQKDPKDRGNWTSGEPGHGVLKGTKYGISAASYPEEDIQNLTLDRAKEIYRRDFWDRLHCDDLGAPLDEYVFDFGVNSGEDRAAMSLQAAVGALQDGDIGPRTLTALKTKSKRDVVRLLFVDRAMIMALNPNDRRYGRGWFARLFDVTTRALVAT